LLPVALCLTINTPASLVECQPTSITWSGATSPVYVAVLKGGDTSSEALKQLGEVPSGSSVTWMVRSQAEAFSERGNDWEYLRFRPGRCSRWHFSVRTHGPKVYSVSAADHAHHPAVPQHSLCHRLQGCDPIQQRSHRNGWCIHFLSRRKLIVVSAFRTNPRSERSSF
jgi:hypothetical protein